MDIFLQVQSEQYGSIFTRYKPTDFPTTDAASAVSITYISALVFLVGINYYCNSVVAGSSQSFLKLHIDAIEWSTRNLKETEHRWRSHCINQILSIYDNVKNDEKKEENIQMLY